ncbi:uncharacterized protein [Rhodnius prolixus]|uniref:uncharacterized protein n=1 Tax=Rhodnius prolixus TaxID=13249 RepID=UPI003D18B004
MLLQAELEPMYIRREEAALKLHERMKRLNFDNWEAKRPPSVRLKVSFWSKVEELCCPDNLGTPLQSLTSIPDRIPSRLAPAVFQLLQPADKESMSSLELRACALETIHTWYPTPPWTHVYTDGSAEEAKKNAGAGVYSEHFQVSVAVGRNASNFDGEIKAIEVALAKLVEREYTHIVLLTDSQAAIAAVTNPAFSSSDSMSNCKYLLERLLFRPTRVVLQWVPAHCGLQGN